jgi:hypothetical protein
MINLAFVFDSYGRQARLYPGLLTLFPPLLMLIAWFPGLITSSIGATLLTIASSCGLLYGLAVLSRSQGKKVEKRLLRSWDGWPTTIWLRHRSEYLQPQTLKRYHQFLTANVPQLSLPSAEEEKLDPRNADFAYASGVKWLQEQCRGKEFPLVEKENAEYGFRRNLLGLRPIGLTVAIIAMILSLVAITNAHQEIGIAFRSFSVAQIWNVIAGLPPSIIGANVVGLIAVVGWSTIVKDKWVREAGDQYARALLACCDTLDSSKRKPNDNTKRASRGRSSK